MVNHTDMQCFIYLCIALYIRDGTNKWLCDLLITKFWSETNLIVYLMFNTACFDWMTLFAM